MENCLNKYFVDELTFDEKGEFLIEVENNDKLKEEFIENQNMLALINWIFPGCEKDQDVVRYKLYKFMREIEQRNDKSV